MIKKFFVLLIGLFLMTIGVMAQGVAENEDIAETTAATKTEPVAYINYIEGEAYFQNFEKAELNMIIQEGYELTSQEGRVEILLKGGGVIRLDRNTRIVFASLTETSILLEVWSGNLYVKKGDLEIGIKSPSRSLNLSQTEWYLTEPEKSFKKWNNEREQELNPNNAENRYLPEELYRYESTLYRYGSWRQYDPYGYVWIPRVAYGYDWQPYLHGRWVWYPILGWTWISYEPFGWSVYHYGRWQWDSLFGWYWIPTRYWGPAWVNWYRYDDYYGWCPRWHDDTYYNRYRNHYDYNSGKALTWVHKNQLRSRDISRSAISKSELARTPRINQDQLRTSVSNPVSKSTMRTATSTNKRIFQNQGDQKITQNSARIQSTTTNSNPRQTQISRKGSPTQIQGYPSRISSHSSTSPQSRISSSSRSSTRSLSSRSSRQSYSPTRRFTNQQSRSYSSPRSSAASISRSSSPRSSSPSRSSGSPRKKN